MGRIVWNWLGDAGWADWVGVLRLLGNRKMSPCLGAQLGCLIMRGSLFCLHSTTGWQQISPIH
jgi:hypothetical protein